MKLQYDESGRIIAAYLDEAVCDGNWILADGISPEEAFSRRVVDGVLTPSWPLNLEDSKRELLSRVQDIKKSNLNGGFIIEDVLFDSDLAARTAYLELGFKISKNLDFSTPWKASDGVWVTMNSQLAENLQVAYEGHIQNCFEWQATKELEIHSATTIEELSNINLNI